MTEMLKRTLSAIALCSLLFSPVAGRALDGADNWRNLTPKEKENIQRNYQRWQNLPPKDKEHLREEWNRWRNLPQDKRDQLRRRYDDLQKSPRDDQKNPRTPRSGRSRWSDDQRRE
jgi:hypothetical protein